MGRAGPERMGFAGPGKRLSRGVWENRPRRMPSPEPGAAVAPGRRPAGTVPGGGKPPRELITPGLPGASGLRPPLPQSLNLEGETGSEEGEREEEGGLKEMGRKKREKGGPERKGKCPCPGLAEMFPQEGARGLVLALVHRRLAQGSVDIFSLLPGKYL